jgi:hemerythrin-like domain-containing protein
MPKRHDALIPLTHDHHHALVQARRLIEAEVAADEERLSVGRSFLEFYEDDTLLHFHEEEEVLFPALLEHVEQAPPELVRVLLEHVAIHGLVSQLRASVEEGDVDGALLKRLGETLKAHVRLEETKLFPLIEQAVPDPDLGRIEFAQRQRTAP